MRVLGAGRTQSKIVFEPLRVLDSSCLLNKSDIPNGCHAEFCSFHGYQVPSNPQLTLEAQILELEILYGLGGVESNSKPEGRSKKFRPRWRSPRGRNFSDLPKGLEFDSTALRPPIRIELDSNIVTDPSPYGIS